MTIQSRPSAVPGGAVLTEYPHDAIIYIFGLGETRFTSSPGENAARRIADALDRIATSPTARFNVKTSIGEKLLVGTDMPVEQRVHTILRNEGGYDIPVIDLYEMDYNPRLVSRYRKMSPIHRSFNLLVSILGTLPNFLRALNPGRRAKNFQAKIQLAYATAILLLLSTYLLLLILGIVEAIVQPLDPNWKHNLINFVEGLRGNAEWLNFLIGLLSGLATVAIVVLGLSEISGKLRQIREQLPEFVIQYIGVLDYLKNGSSKRQIMGHIMELIEHIAETNAYRRVHVVAYSFGAIVALDSLFRPGAPPPERLQIIHTLATIGCPFDLIRLIWPNYFRGRVGRQGAPERWLNVYSQIDVLASNFRDDNKSLPPDERVLGTFIINGSTLPENIEHCTTSSIAERLSLVETLRLAGLYAHADYWPLTYSGSVTCFDSLVEYIYGGDPLLS